MKTMGLHDMCLVAPCDFSVHKGDAHALSSGAMDVLENARIVDELPDAISDCAVVIGASARQRTMRWPQLSPDQAAKTLIEAAKRQPVAMVFGRERTGLENDELGHCHSVSYIEANPGYSSLNLAMAVQVFSYEIRRAALDSELVQAQATVIPKKLHRDDIPATAGELNFLFTRLENVLDRVDFLFQQDPQYMVRKLKRMVYRAQLEHKEINIVQGIFTSVENKIKQLELLAQQNANLETES